MVCLKLFFTYLFFFVSIFTLKSHGEEFDESLIGNRELKKDTEVNQSISEEEVVNKSYNVDIVSDGNGETENENRKSAGDVQQIDVDATAKEVFKDRIEKAKQVSDIKVINKVKYGSDLVDEIDEGHEDEKKNIVVNRKVMKKNGPVNFKIDVKDSADTKAGLAMQSIRNGYNSYNVGDYELAVYFYKEALKENPESVEAQFGLGVSYQKLMQFDQAIECYLKLLNNNFSRKKVVSNLLLALSHKSYKDALDILLTIDEKVLGYDDILSQIGVLYMRLGDNVKAISAFTKAFEIAPTNAIVCYNLGVLYDKEENLDYAKYFWDQAFKNDISEVLSSEDLKKLNKRLKEVSEAILAETEKKKK